VLQLRRVLRTAGGADNRRQDERTVKEEAAHHRLDSPADLAERPEPASADMSPAASMPEDVKRDLRALLTKLLVADYRRFSLEKCEGSEPSWLLVERCNRSREADE
jgi:hypothetical protein